MKTGSSFILKTTSILTIRASGFVPCDVVAATAEIRLTDATAPPPAAAPPSWPGQARADCPFPQSKTLMGLAFTGRHAEYTKADTWYPSWAVDGNMYSPWTDGRVNGLGCSSAGGDAATGHATIPGDDSLDLTVTGQAVFKSSPLPYEARYPCGRSRRQRRREMDKRFFQDQAARRVARPHELRDNDL